MKKKNTNYEYDIKPTIAEESQALYGLSQYSKLTKDFTFSDFKKIAEKVDFTQKEWSDILHISERTLQRYAHENSTFNTGVSDRILQINKVLQRGKEVFGSYARFNLWLRGNPYMLEGQLSIHSLASIEGINNVLTQLGRIEHGILA
ncbi:MAG TPA: antitoxin Xre-like helix-turn-helix domain-containing protein [Hanamia sp.]|nr:antitoxin Xre-like helix-turn-helix domain-containing protein [Hanamia sp.]